MIEPKNIAKGMKVRIDKDCSHSKLKYEFYNPKKLELLGTVRKVQDVKLVSGIFKRITIDNWFFDERDVYPIMSEEDIMHIAPEVLEKNKQEKPKIYFNPEKL